MDSEKSIEILFKIDDNLDIVALLPTGYPADDVEISPLHKKYIEMNEMAEYNSI